MTPVSPLGAANDRALDFLRRGDGVTDEDGVLGAPAQADLVRLVLSIAEFA